MSKSSKGDYVNPEATRALQGSEAAIQANYATLLNAGVYNVVKVTPKGPLQKSVGGYLTLLTHISGKTAREIEIFLGLKPNQLAAGADIYRLQRLPKKDEFLPRGYTQMPDGKILRDGLNSDNAGYRRGQGGWQVTLKHGVYINAILLDTIQGAKPFKPGTHPATAAVYPKGHPVRANLRR